MSEIINYDTNNIRIINDGNVNFYSKENLTVEGNNGNVIIYDGTTTVLNIPYTSIKNPRSKTLNQVVTTIQSYIDEYVAPLNLTNGDNDKVAYLTTTNLGANEIYDSGILELLPGYTQVQTNITADQDGTISIFWYSDAKGTDVVRALTLPYTAANGYQSFGTAATFGVYVRYKFINGATPQGDFYYSTVFLTHAQSAQILNIESPVSPKMIAQMTRSVIMGTTDGGVYKNVPITPEGHLEVAVHSPRNPFGSIHTEELTPIFQTDAVYGLNAGQVNNGVTGTGSASSVDSTFTCTTGTTIYSSSYIQSRKRLRYRAGQGIVGRFTASFTTGVADSYQVVGFGHAEDGIYVGYKGTEFGIIYNHHGVREIQTLTITNAATGAGNVTVTLGGVANTIAVSASAIGNIARTVYELSLGTYTGWKVQPNGAGTELIFLADSVGDKTGTFSVAGSGVVGNFVEDRAGAAVTEEFIPQTSFNGDRLNGAGGAFNPSGFTIDPTKLNVFQIDIQYLGAGTIAVEMEVTSEDNNAEFIVIHALKLPNTLTKTSFSNPSFPFTMSAYSAGSTTDLTVKCGSFAGFIEGKKKLNGNRFSYFNAITTATAASYTALFTFRNSFVHVDKANQSVINVLSMNGAVKHTQPVVFYLIKNATLSGNPSFSDYASDISATTFDNSATTCTFSSNAQLVWTGHLGETGEIDHEFAEGGPEELTLEPGESLTLAVKAVQNSPAWVTGSINTREDQ